MANKTGKKTERNTRQTANDLLDAWLDVLHGGNVVEAVRLSTRVAKLVESGIEPIWESKTERHEFFAWQCGTASVQFTGGNGRGGARA